MINEYDMFNNFICQKVIPLVYDESLSYYEVLNKLIQYTNEMVTSVNEVIVAHNDLSGEYKKVLIQLNELKEEINKMKLGFDIKDGSITLNKLSKECLNKIQEFTVNTVQNISKFVWFGLDDKGYFYAIIPETWKEIIFSTSLEGNLVLEY